MTAPTQVLKRHTFFLHGFDPRGPGAYHELYSEDAAKQALLDGTQITVGRRRNDGKQASYWDVSSTVEGVTTQTRYEFLRWDDMIRRHWPRGRWALLSLMLSYLRAFFQARFLNQLRRTARPAFLAIMFPPFLVLCFALIGLGLGAGLGVLAVAAGLPSWAGLLVFALVAAAWVLAWDKLETAWNPCWLARVFGYLVYWAEDRIEGLEERHQLFATRIAAGLDDPEPQEILVVGHSIGAQHAIASLVRLEEIRPGSLADPRLKLVTLGQCIPLLARLRGAERFREDVGRLVVDYPLKWIDVTSPADPASSCAVDPLAPTLRVRDASQPMHPIQVSPRFHVLLPREAFRKIRRDPLLFHFQYLRAQEIAGPYSFFAITAGGSALQPPGRRIDWTLHSSDLSP
jgi:hypothetical protein